MSAIIVTQAAGSLTTNPHSHRFVISWDISPQWQVETDPDRTSEVEVRFISELPERTRVELEHHNLDRHGEGWEAERDGVPSDTSTTSTNTFLR